jgi:penicillin amidase
MTGKARRWLGWVIAAAAVLFVVLLLLGAWLWVTRRPYPQTRGRMRVEGISAPVEILRDRYGVPHIYARAAADLFFAEGFVHAQDRFWQMEFWRRVSSGRLSELFGKSTLETDKFLRTLGFHRVAQQEFEALPAETRGYMEAYAAGVNAYALKRHPARLGLEFAILMLQGVKVRIEPWTPADSIAWGKMMAYDLGANHLTERLHLDVLRAVGPKLFASYFAPYRSDMPFTVDPKELKKMLGAALGLSRAGTAARAGAAAGADAEPQGLAAALGPDGSQGLGSNNWVVSGKRTASGKPLLCNDMHLGIQMPSIWYEIALHGVAADGTVGRTPACPFELRGYSFPGAPGVIAGHNDRIAWAHTNLGGDVQDFYVEKLNPDNPDQYEVNGRWVDMDVRVETIKVHKADEPYVFRVRSTRHGPVLSDRKIWSELASFSVSNGKEFPAGAAFTAVSLRWTALQPGRLFEAVILLDRATNFQEFRDALRRWDVPAQNVLYADVDGNIGYQVPGLQPIRAGGHHGLAPSPGWTDEYEWTGYIPFDELPYLYNPDAGYIATANAPPVGPEYPYYLGSEFAFGERARRIRELIEAKPGGLTIEDMKAIHGDVYDQYAAEVVPYLRGLDLTAARKPREPEPETEKQRLKREAKEKKELAAMGAARDRLLAWDFQLKRESPEAALYGFFWIALVEETFQDQYPEQLWPPERSGRLENAFHYLLKDPQNAWWDDLGTPEVKETRDQVLARAFRKGYRAAVKKMGNKPERWRWGKVHTAVFKNQSLGSSGIKPIERIFNRGPFAVPGGNTTVDVAAWNMEKPFQVVHIASQRSIIDLGNLANSLMVHTTGQSGHTTNRHYDDFIRPWRDVRYHPTLWERAQVEKSSREKLRLEPAR